MNFDRRLRRVTFLAAVLGMLALGLGEPDRRPHLLGEEAVAEEA